MTTTVAPSAKIVRNRRHAPCPQCGTECGRHSRARRTVRRLDGTVVVEYSKHFCPRCIKYFSLQEPELAEKFARYSVDAIATALAMLRTGKTMVHVAAELGIPVSTLHGWRTTNDHDEGMPVL